MADIRIGPAGWSYSDWAGYVYPTPRPKGFHEATYLAQFFDTIEINTSFYQPLNPEHAKQWIERVSANPRFVFTAKMWQKFAPNLPASMYCTRPASWERCCCNSLSRFIAMRRQLIFLRLG